MPDVVERAIDEAARQRLVAGGCEPRLARLFAARGLASVEELATTLHALAPPERLSHVREAAALLADAIARREKLLVVADYDADGATACAVAVKALRAMGALVDYIVPNRAEHGYGITPEIVDEAAARKPGVLITVDNGIAALDGVARANALGMRVLVTDHHLPGAELPSAACIVNPNQSGCGFPSKNLAGVGVVFYVMLALRAELRARGAFAARPEPNLADVLDLVALGTVADVVKLDANNRILVAQGLARIRAAKASPGIAALFEVGGRSMRSATAHDLGFVAGPRLNAAGRLDDMALGIECLLATDAARAMELAIRLDRLNRERREIEGEMQESALALIGDVRPDGAYTLSLHHPQWHAGVVGVLASRLKDRFHRPVFAFAAERDGRLKGSGRSIAGLHLRDALDMVAKRRHGLLERFGGHAGAAGATIGAQALGEFRDAFESVARDRLTPADLSLRIETDGALGAGDIDLDFARALKRCVWGHGFPEPRFVGRFSVESQRVVGERHVKAVLACDGRRYGAIRFGNAEPLAATIDAVYRLEVDDFHGEASVQLVLEHTV